MTPKPGTRSADALAGPLRLDRARFDPQGNDPRHVDGKLRHDGVAAFLRSRGIELPWGDPDDPPEAQTVCGPGHRKNEIFGALLERAGGFGLVVGVGVDRGGQAVALRRHGADIVLEDLGAVGVADAGGGA